MSVKRGGYISVRCLYMCVHLKIIYIFLREGIEKNDHEVKINQYQRIIDALPLLLCLFSGVIQFSVSLVRKNNSNSS